MSWLLQKRNYILVVCVCLQLALLAGCEYDSDGPIKPSSTNQEYDGKGFFRAASLDSGKAIHLASDTLFLTLGNIWTFSNCALKSIDLNYDKQGDVLWIAPTIDIHVDEEECAAPFYRPDSVFKLSLDEETLDGVGQVKVRNDVDSTLDSILVRRGHFVKDTFSIYVDSSFVDAHNFPLRTKAMKGDDSVPTVLRVLDSLTSRVFFWRTMRSNCTHRVDMCEDVVADTIYPSSWSVNDTNLVPVHYSCADSNLVYCINSKWTNDSTSLGELQERPDTIWHYSTYYVEKIPKCASFNAFSMTLLIGQANRYIRELFVPDESETACGPASAEEWMFYSLPGSRMVLDNDSVSVVDGLMKAWNDAEIAPDTLIVKDE